MKKEAIFCCCGSSEHAIVINSFPEDKEDNLLYVDIGVVQRKGWLGKLRFIWDYLCSNNNNSPYFVEVLLDKEQQEKLVSVVQKHLDN